MTQIACSCIKIGMYYIWIIKSTEKSLLSEKKNHHGNSVMLFWSQFTSIQKL